MDSNKKERGEHGVACSLLRLSDGRLRVVLDDVRNLAPGESGSGSVRFHPERTPPNPCVSIGAGIPRPDVLRRRKIQYCLHTSYPDRHGRGQNAHAGRRGILSAVLASEGALCLQKLDCRHGSVAWPELPHGALSPPGPEQQALGHRRMLLA